MGFLKISCGLALSPRQVRSPFGIPFSRGKLPLSSHVLVIIYDGEKKYLIRKTLQVGLGLKSAIRAAGMSVQVTSGCPTVSHLENLEWELFRHATTSLVERGGAGQRRGDYGFSLITSKVSLICLQNVKEKKYRPVPVFAVRMQPNPRLSTGRPSHTEP